MLRQRYLRVKRYHEIISQLNNSPISLHLFDTYYVPRPLTSPKDTTKKWDNRLCSQKNEEDEKLTNRL